MLDTKVTLKINDANFDQIVKEGVALVDFWAEWCGPCRIQGPIMEKIAEKIGDKARICKINVDDNPVTAMKFEVTSIPTLILFNHGVVVERFTGLQSESVLLEAVQKLL